MAQSDTHDGRQKLGVHIDDEPANLWPHLNDDDLPDPIALKRSVVATRRKDYHRGIRLTLRLNPLEYKRLQRLQRRRGLTVMDWFRRALELDEKERPSEAGQYVRRIVPEQVAIESERWMSIIGQILFAAADQQTDWEAKKAMRAQAGVVMDTAAYHTDVRRDWERLIEPPKSQRS